LVDELAPDGRMVIPLGGQEVQVLSVVEKDANGGASVRPVMPVRFTQLELVS
jgi:protein-L-isoaspartate(D-aspartate) O-methyltransferase